MAQTVTAQADKPTFTDVTQQAGIDFRYTFGDFTYDNILESSGSGVTVFDYDGDGDLDLYLLNGTYLEDISDPKGRVFRDTPDRLYRNNGDGTFTEVGEAAGLDDRYWSMAAAPVDYDADGDLDIYPAQLRPEPLLPQQRQRHVHRHRARVGAGGTGDSSTAAPSGAWGLRSGITTGMAIWTSWSGISWPSIPTTCPRRRRT